jgi:hypothetical protein
MGERRVARGNADVTVPIFTNGLKETQKQS